MAETTRRSALGLIGAAFLGTSLHGERALGGELVREATLGTDTLRLTLAEARQRIQTLEVRFRIETVESKSHDWERQWFTDGEDTLLYRHGAYKVVHTRGDVEFTETVVSNTYTQHARSLTGERAPETLYVGPVTGSSRLGVSLEQFLPVPEDLPMLYKNANFLRGTLCQVWLQGRTLFWVDPSTPSVVRREIFGSSSHVRETVDFKDFRQILPGLQFPKTLEAVQFSPVGEEARRLLVEVTELSVNHRIPKRMLQIQE